MSRLSIGVLPLLVACGSPSATESRTVPLVPSSSPTTPPTQPAVINGQAPDAVDVPVPPACAQTALPIDDPCVIHESFGVFVSSSKGSPDGDGSRAAPLATLDEAILLAKKTRRRVYACAETYREAVTFADAISLFGYFECTTEWKVSSSSAARIASPTSPALTAVDIQQPTRIEGLEAIAPDAILPGASSIAMRAVKAGGLELVNVRLEARSGAPGADGVAAVQLVETGAIDGLDALKPLTQFGCALIYGAGCSSRYAQSRPAGVSQCSGATGFDGGPGGVGGRPGVYQRDQSNLVLPTTQPELGSPVLATAETAQGAWSVSAAIDGAAGANGADGTSATNSLGTFTSQGFVPASGIGGTHGQPGQGGGGGRAVAPAPELVKDVPWFGASGAGGGAGGCPGLAGAAGQGGGASVALLAHDSPMRIERSELRSGRGGDGGQGTLGSEPTPGGHGGAVASDDPLTRGGNGGRGGRAGVSGHGAGGPSIAIAQHGAAPTLVASSTIAGIGGAGQREAHTADRSVGASAPGSAKATHAF